MITYTGREKTPTWAKAAGIGLFCAILAAIAFFSYAKWTRFMEECTADRPRYECEVLWQQMYPPTPTVNVYNKG